MITRNVVERIMAHDLKKEIKDSQKKYEKLKKERLRLFITGCKGRIFK